MVFGKPGEPPGARIHTETLGEIKLVSISDGGINYPAKMIFGNVPSDQAECLGVPEKQVFVQYTIQLIQTPDRLILVDVGAGDFGSKIDAFFPGLDHATSKTGLVVEGLKAAGISPEDIETVIITHAHVDHVGGLREAGGAPAFPHARYYIGRKEREYWEQADPTVVQAEALREHLANLIAFARTAFDAMGDSITLIDEGGEVVPGVRIESSFGHTPGHNTVSVSSQGQTAYNISDMVIHPLFIEHPEWSSALDMDWNEADDTRRRFYKKAAEERALVFAHHLGPFPNLGRIQSKERGWQWEPLCHG